MAGPLEMLFGASVLTELDTKLARDYESQFTNRLPKLAEKIRTNNWAMYDVIDIILDANAKETYNFSANTLTIIDGVGLEISFNANDKFFPLDVDTPITNFPFFQFTVYNPNAVAVTAKILVMVRGLI